MENDDNFVCGRQGAEHQSPQEEDQMTFIRFNRLARILSSVGTSSNNVITAAQQHVKEIESLNVKKALNSSPCPCEFFKSFSPTSKKRMEQLDVFDAFLCPRCFDTFGKTL